MEDTNFTKWHECKCPNAERVILSFVWGRGLIYVLARWLYEHSFQNQCG